MYDDHCIQFDCYIQEESDSDSETWPHQNTSDIKEEHEEIEDHESEEANREDTYEEVDEKDKSKTTVLQKGH